MCGPTPLLGDNSASYDMINKEGVTPRTRYFERATIFVKYAVMKLIVKMYLVSTKEMIADGFTKAVDAESLHRTRNELMNINKSTAWALKGYKAKAERLMTALSDTLARVEL